MIICIIHLFVNVVTLIVEFSSSCQRRYKYCRLCKLFKPQSHRGQGVYGSPCSITHVSFSHDKKAIIRQRNSTYTWMFCSRINPSILKTIFDFCFTSPQIINVTNHTYGKVTIQWNCGNDRTFSVMPMTMDIPPLKSCAFQVTFKPVSFNITFQRFMIDR